MGKIYIRIFNNSFKMQSDLIKNISVIILTYNEELNIGQALKSVSGWAEEIIVLDSGSVDNTINIANSFGAKVINRQFDNYANQRNYALKELPVTTEWILFLDADEYLTDELKNEIENAIIKNNIDGYYIKFKFYFLDKWIKHGGYYPTWIMRLCKKDKATVSRDMNEHIQISGKIGYLENPFIHKDNKGISDWIAKHNKYATYEAEELLKYKQRKQAGEKDGFANLSGSQAQKKRWIREYIWNPLMPPLIRPFIYFFYRYIIRLGFLDGKAGFVYHFLQGLLYPFLIDVKYLELRRKNNVK
ncbi:MAG: glycosyltransferase family 2 protein [Ignavibacteria bacterium]|nr:glycosyltransferase family 2 protein [Ignavibacteria bacterium]